MPEHKQLDALQFSISVDTNGNKELHYTGRLCKNVQGGLNNRNVDVKRITQKSDPSNPRCIVKVFDKYLQHIPREGRFYRKPLVNKGSDTSIRFSVQSIGINTLSNRMKDLFQAAGIPLENRNITNHSGKLLYYSVQCWIFRFKYFQVISLSILENHHFFNCIRHC
jgi:hypothetical protein